MNEIPEVVANDAPEVVEEVETVAAPEAPEVPETPEVPEAPEVPETPVVPEAPAAVEKPAEVLPAEPKVQKEKKQKKAKKRRSAPVRILMGLIAFVLCIAMFGLSFAGVLILNVRAVVSRDGISSIVNQLISGPTASGPVRPALATGAGVYQNEFSAGSEVTGSLVDWAYDMLKQQLGEEMAVTKEQVQTFVQESTVKDFVVDKVAGLVEDFYSGDNETTITVDEVIELMQENKQILEEQFGVVINQEAVDVVTTLLEENQVLEPLKEDGLLGYIEKTMTDAQKPVRPGVDGGIVGGGDTEDVLGSETTEETVGSAAWIMDIVRKATSYETVAALGGAFALLMLLLFAVTGFSFPATLADTGIVLLLTGLIFGLPTAVCLYAPVMVAGAVGVQVAGILSLIFGAAAGVNFTVLGVGFGLIVLAIVVKILQLVKARKA